MFISKKSIKFILLKDFLWSKFSLLIFLFWLLILIFFFSYIFVMGAKGLLTVNLKNIFYNWDFSLASNNLSFISPLIVTTILCISVIILGIPFSLKCAVWLNIYKKLKISKIINLFIKLFCSLPPIFFGVFIIEFISPFLTKIGFGNNLNIIFAILVLVILSTPNVIALFLRDINSEQNLINIALSIGMNKRKAIYKLIIPNMHKSIFIGVSIIFARVVGESVIMNTMLSSENYGDIFKKGFFNIFISKLNPLSPLIASNFQSDSATDNKKALLFSFSLLLMLYSFACNRFIIWLSKKEFKKWNIKKKLEISICNRLIKMIFFNKIVFRSSNKVVIHEYIQKYQKFNIWERYFYKFKHLLESFCIFLLSSVMIFMVSIIVSIGVWSIIKNPYSLISTTGLLRALINTIFIVVCVLWVSIPISLISSLYLSEYCKSSKIKKISLAAYNLSAATPSVVFGMFGAYFLIGKLGLTYNGTEGKSLLVGIMVLSILITSHMILAFYNQFRNINQTSKEAAYSLGLSKWATFKSICLVDSKNNIFSSIVLFIGRLMGENISLLLTAGYSSLMVTGFMYPGQTLTTMIWDNNTNNMNLTKSLEEICKSGLFIIIIVSLIIVLYSISVNRDKIKK